MNITTKGDLVLAALRKIGIASNATLTDVEPQSVEDGVNDLEMMMAEWFQNGNGIDAGYVFTPDDTPVDPGDLHGMKTSSLSAVTHNLAVRIAPDYEVEPPSKWSTPHVTAKSCSSRFQRPPRPRRLSREWVIQTACLSAPVTVFRPLIT